MPGPKNRLVLALLLLAVVCLAVWLARRNGGVGNGQVCAFPGTSN